MKYQGEGILEMKYRILILEDDEGRIIKFRRKFIGHHIEIYDTDSEIMQKLEYNGPWDYLFLDHDLGLSSANYDPGDGYQVAKFLYRNPHYKPRIAIVIHSMNPSGAEAMKKILPEAHIHPFSWM